METRGLLCALALAFAAGCTARVSAPGVGADGQPGTGLTAGGAGAGVTPQGGQPLDCSQPSVAYAPLRRLTREQYDNAVRDLFGAQGHPSLALSADEKLAAFFSNSVSPVTRLSVEQYADAAEEVAQGAAAGDLAELSGCAGDEQNAACADRFIQSFGRRVFRRPLTAEETARYLGLFTGQQARGFGAAVRVVLQTMLQSPHFVYHLELTPAPAGAGVTPLAGYEVASRLSFALWNTTPDAELLDAAEAGLLDSKEGLRAQAERLLGSERARDAMASFHLQWLGLENVAEAAKDGALFPQLTPALKIAMREETVSFADFVVRRGDGRLETLLSAPFTVASADLLSLYGATSTPAADGTVALDAAQRAGLLTQAAFLATHAHSNQTSPVHRGLAVRKNLLCTNLPDPPMNVDNTPPEPDPQATTRQRFEQHRADPSCKGCHELLDPIGVGFEGYDAIGRYRADENGLALDVQGDLVDAGEASGPFTGAVELANRLATSARVRECVQKQWFRFSLGRLEGEQDACSLQSLAQDFAASDYDVRALLLSLVTSDAFRFRKVAP